MLSTSWASAACCRASTRSALAKAASPGFALPVRLEPKSNDPSAYRFGGGVGKPLEQVLQTMKDGDVVVMDLGGSDRAAAWGGLASRIAQRRGVRGTVMWGSCRDVEEIRAIGYPVWSVARARAAAATTSRSADQRADHHLGRHDRAARLHARRRERRPRASRRRHRRGARARSDHRRAGGSLEAQVINGTLFVLGRGVSFDPAACRRIGRRDLKVSQLRRRHARRSARSVGHRRVRRRRVLRAVRRRACATSTRAPFYGLGLAEHRLGVCLRQRRTRFARHLVESRPAAATR